MSDVTVQFSDEQLEAILRDGIAQAFDQESRERMVTDAIARVFTAPEDGMKSYVESYFQDAIRVMIREEVEAVVATDHFKLQARLLLQKGIEKMLDDHGSAISNQLADTFTEALARGLRGY